MAPFAFDRRTSRLESPDWCCGWGQISPPKWNTREPKPGWKRCGMGPQTRRSKWPATLACCSPNKCLPRWCTSPQLLKHNLLMDEGAREGEKKFPMGPAGSGTKTGTSSPTNMSFVGRNRLRSNWKPVISAEPRSKALIRPPTLPSWP